MPKRAGNAKVTIQGIVGLSAESPRLLPFVCLFVIILHSAAYGLCVNSPKLLGALTQDIGRKETNEIYPSHRIPIKKKQIRKIEEQSY
jgi:hypothetical protein